MSVTEAAEMLAVHPQRIHQRIRDGSLPAEKVGNQWVIEMNDVRRLKRHAGPGRPLTSKSAWDLLAVAASDQTAAELSPSARSRGRSRLRNLLVHAKSDDPEGAALHLVRALGNRAERALLVASPRDLPDIRDDERVHPSGVSLPDSNISAGDIAEAYVLSHEVPGLIENYLLSPAARPRANVILHIAPSGVEHPALADLDALARSRLALAADLAEHDGIREKNEAIRSLAELDAASITRPSHTIGANRD